MKIPPTVEVYLQANKSIKLNKKLFTEIYFILILFIIYYKCVLPGWFTSLKNVICIDILVFEFKMPRAVDGNPYLTLFITHSPLVARY